MIDPSAQAFTAAGIERSGVVVTFQRVSGFAPNTFIFSADLKAIVSMDRDDGQEVGQTGYGSRKPGAITQDSRDVIVMASALSAARFPLPLRKHDRVILALTGEKFSIIHVNPYKRALAGAIELTIVGVS